MRFFWDSGAGPEYQGHKPTSSLFPFLFFPFWVYFYFFTYLPSFSCFRFWLFSLTLSLQQSESACSIKPSVGWLNEAWVLSGEAYPMEPCDGKLILRYPAANWKISLKLSLFIRGLVVRPYCQPANSIRITSEQINLRLRKFSTWIKLSLHCTFYYKAIIIKRQKLILSYFFSIK